MLKLENNRRHFPSASSALVIASILGLTQAFFLIFAGKPILNYMGVDSVSVLCSTSTDLLYKLSLLKWKYSDSFCVWDARMV